MSLDDLETDVSDAKRELEAEGLDFDRETENELAMLAAALDPDDPEELVRRAVHMLFQSAVETGKLDFHLRTTYDVTYDEYLSGMTFEEMTGQQYSLPEDDRRYQF